MKIALFFDLHAHPYNNGTILEGGINSRVQDAVDVINQVYSYSIQNGVEYVLFGGDLFDRRKSIDVDTFNCIHKSISEWSEKIPTLMIPGNHDQANKSGTIHALQRFRSRGCVIPDRPLWCELHDRVHVFACPYYDDGRVIAEHIRTGIEDKPSGDHFILLIHYGIEGARIGPSDYVLPCELKLPMLCLDEWDLVFSGHYHIGQQLGSKFHYIGSAMQHRWDDVGFEKSFVVYDTADGSLIRVPTTAPKFLVIKDEIDNYDVNNSIIRIIRNYEIDAKKKSKIEKKLKEKGALSVEFRYEPEKLESEKSERIKFSESGGEYQILDDYINSGLVEISKFDKDKLIKLGKETLSNIIGKL